MTDNEKNNSRDVTDGEQVDNDYLPPDAKPLCRRCLQPCNPLQYYCTNCGSNEAINPLAAYMPYVRLRFSIGIFAKLVRRALDGENPLSLRIVYGLSACLWLLFNAY